MVVTVGTGSSRSKGGSGVSGKGVIYERGRYRDIGGDGQEPKTQDIK